MNKKEPIIFLLTDDSIPDEDKVYRYHEFPNIWLLLGGLALGYMAFCGIMDALYCILDSLGVFSLICNLIGWK